MLFKKINEVQTIKQSIMDKKIVIIATGNDLYLCEFDSEKTATAMAKVLDELQDNIPEKLGLLFSDNKGYYPGGAELVYTASREELAQMIKDYYGITTEYASMMEYADHLQRLWPRD